MAIRDLGKAVFDKMQADDAMGGAAELAFRFMFALFPLVIFLAALSSYVARWVGIENPTQDILNEAGTHLPSDVTSLLRTQLTDIFETQNPGLLTVTALTAIWSASSGTKTVMKVLNRVYEVTEERSIVRKQLVGVGLTLVGGFAFLAGAIVLVIGQAAGDGIADALGLEGAWTWAVMVGRIPLVLILIGVAVSLVYWSAPSADLPVKWVSWGAGLFVLMWVVATVGFGIYVANFGSYNATYGSLGAVVILMTWLYYSSLLLILGAELNVVIERARLRAEGVEDAQLAQRQSRAMDAAVQPAQTPGD
jgi:membrane protein